LTAARACALLDAPSSRRTINHVVLSPRRAVKEARMRGAAAAAATLSLLFTTSVVAAQERTPTDRPEPPLAVGREHFQLKFGAGYDQGDFGTRDTTRSFYTPVTVRYLGDRFDVGVTASIIYLDTESSVVIVDGVPTPTGKQEHTQSFGFGDLYFKGRYYLIEDKGPQSWVPGLAPFLKVKAPTANADKGFGTGEWDVGFGLEWDKLFREFFLLGDVSYTFMGDPPGQDFRNRPGASIGIGRQLTRELAATVLLDWRRAIVAGHDDAVELNGILQWRLSRTLLFSPYIFVGLTSGSPDFGLGFEVSWKFGRY
jgi:hypothetical protein